MALPLRPYHPQRFIHQKFHPNPTKMFKHLQREACRTRSAVEVQHSSSPQAFYAKPTGPDQPFRFSMALPIRPSMRRICDRTRSAVEVQHGSSPQAIGSSPQAISRAALHPSKCFYPNPAKNVQASSLRSPLDQISG